MNTHHWTVRVALAAALIGGLHSLSGRTFAAETQSAIRRFDPRNRELVPVKIQDVEPGKIYNHFSASRNRYVWAYALEDGKFSYALGPGSTESPSNFDLTTSAQETEQLYEQRTYGELKGAWGAGSYMARLGGDDQWAVLPFSMTASRSHYDLDSGRRWEWHGDRRVAVGHTNGYTWLYADGRYVPANPWLGSNRSAQQSCLCAP